MRRTAVISVNNSTSSINQEEQMEEENAEIFKNSVTNRSDSAKSIKSKNSFDCKLFLLLKIDENY